MNKKINIKMEELVQLKTQGMRYDEIAKYFTEKGKKISTGTVYSRLEEYYELQCIEKPKRKNKINIDTSEIIELKKEGMSCEEIAKYFTEKGKKISTKSIYNRLEKYYESQSEEKQDEISDIELVELKEQRMSDKAIAEYFTQRGKKISQYAVYNRLKIYYKLHSRPKPKLKRKNKIDIDTREIVQLKEQGMSDKEIAEHFTKIGKKISRTTIIYRLKKYYEEQNIEKIKSNKKSKEYDDEIKEILMNGMTVEEYISEYEVKGNKEYIKKKIEKLSIVAEYSKKENGEFKPDNGFIEVLTILENPIENINKYKKQLKTYLIQKSEKDMIESIKNEIFNGNIDLMIYTLVRFNISFYEEKDNKNFDLLKNKYEEKIDEYLRRLETVEDSRKNKKEQIEKVNFKKREKEFDE